MDNLQWIDGKLILALWVASGVAMILWMIRVQRRGDCEHLYIALLLSQAYTVGIITAPAMCIRCKTHMYAVIVISEDGAELLEAHEADC